MSVSVWRGVNLIRRSARSSAQPILQSCRRSHESGRRWSARRRKQFGSRGKPYTSEGRPPRGYGRRERELRHQSENEGLNEGLLWTRFLGVLSVSGNPLEQTIGQPEQHLDVRVASRHIFILSGPLGPMLGPTRGYF